MAETVPTHELRRDHSCRTWPTSTHQVWLGTDHGVVGVGGGECARVTCALATPNCITALAAIQHVVAAGCRLPTIGSRAKGTRVSACVIDRPTHGGAIVTLLNRAIHQRLLNFGDRPAIYHGYFRLGRCSSLHVMNGSRLIWLIRLALLVGGHVPLIVQLLKELTLLSLCQSPHLVVVHGAEAWHSKHRLGLLRNFKILVNTAAKDLRMCVSNVQLRVSVLDLRVEALVVPLHHLLQSFHVSGIVLLHASHIVLQPYSFILYFSFLMLVFFHHAGKLDRILLF